MGAGRGPVRRGAAGPSDGRAGGAGELAPEATVAPPVPQSHGVDGNGWQERDPDGVPARWLRGEMDTTTALTRCLLSDRLDWQLWAEWTLGSQVLRPSSFVSILSVC